jgi:hypothetical protein
MSYCFTACVKTHTMTRPRSSPFFKKNTMTLIFGYMITSDS